MLSTRAILKRPTFVMMILAALVGFAAPAAADIEVVGNTHGDADAIGPISPAPARPRSRRGWRL